MPELTVADAVLLATGCQNNPDRTFSIHVINQTNAAIKICFFQVKTKSTPPAGYIRDTGVFIGGVNLAPRQNCDADPCLTGGVNRGPIIGHVFSGSLSAVENGHEQTLNFPVKEFEPPEYAKSYGWTMRYQADSLNKGGAPVYELRPSTLLATE